MAAKFKSKMRLKDKSKLSSKEKSSSRKVKDKPKKKHPISDDVADIDGIDSEEENSDDDALAGNQPEKWYETFSIGKYDAVDVSDLEQNKLRREAGAIFNEEITAANSKPPKAIPKSDYKWVKKMIVQGTLNDKIAAYVLLIQDDPISNMNHLKNMVSMVKVGKKRECFMTMDTVVQLFLEDLLPPDRKLVPFARQPLAHIDKITHGDPAKRRQLLCVWFFEDQLKQTYSSFLAALNQAVHDSVEANKANVITALNKLLSGHAEQEDVILSHIVNKLGDPSPKVVSKVIFCLTKLLGTHPAMKGVVMEEVEKVIFRPNMNKRAQYYAICFLTQFTFHAEEGELAASLISIYFSLFKACVKTGEVDSRIMSALLTGVSRAYPYAKNSCDSLKDHIDTLYKVLHLSGTNVSIHSLCLLNLISGDEPCDRFMTALYKKIGEPSMYHATHHAMFINLIFKAMMKDKNNGRINAFIKRLLQVAIQLPVPVVCGILILISQLLHSRKKNFSLRWTEEAKPDVSTLILDNDDEDEHYKDCVLDGPEKNEDVKDPNLTAAGSSWYHAAQKSKGGNAMIKKYDPYQRNPLYCCGELSVPVELNQLCRHFHPTVALFAENIVKGITTKYTGDPLQDFSLIRFLDKFAYKNPKKINSEGGMFSTFTRKKNYISQGVKRLRANTKEYLALDEKNIPVDERFMYKYLKEKAGADDPDAKNKDDEDSDSDAESLNDEEFEVLMRGMGGHQKDDVDFMKEIGTLPSTGKEADEDDNSENEMGEGSSGDEEMGDDDDNDDSDDFDDDAEDGEKDLSGDELSDDGSFAEDFDGDELDDFGEGSELESEDEDTPPKAKKKLEINPKKKKQELKPKAKKNLQSKRKKSKTESFFANAEEYAELLEADSYKAGTSSAMSNKDNAGLKQLEWETSRNDWIRGRNFKKSKKVDVDARRKFAKKRTKKINKNSRKGVKK